MTKLRDAHEAELDLLRERQRRGLLELHLSRVLHDLANHLHAIELRTSFLCNQRDSLGDSAELFDSILQSAQAAQRRIQATRPGVPEPLAHRVSASDALAWAVALARRDGGAVMVAPRVLSLPPVRGRRDLLALVFLNLFDNAREANAAAFVDGRCDDDQVILTVSDDGPGLPAELPIWKPFVSSKPGHLGHGLPMAAQLVQLAGGTLHGSDRSDPPGACFTLTLPRG